MKLARFHKVARLKRQGDGAKLNGSGIIIAETRGACVIARN